MFILAFLSGCDILIFIEKVIAMGFMGYTGFKILIKFISNQCPCTDIGLKHQNRSENLCNDHIIAQPTQFRSYRNCLFITVKFQNVFILAFCQQGSFVRHFICRH